MEFSSLSEWMPLPPIRERTDHGASPVPSITSSALLASSILDISSPLTSLSSYLVEIADKGLPSYTPFVNAVISPFKLPELDPESIRGTLMLEPQVSVEWPDLPHLDLGTIEFDFESDDGKTAAEVDEEESEECDMDELSNEGNQSAPQHMKMHSADRDVFIHTSPHEYEGRRPIKASTCRINVSQPADVKRGGKVFHGDHRGHDDCTIKRSRTKETEKLADASETDEDRKKYMSPPSHFLTDCSTSGSVGVDAESSCGSVASLSPDCHHAQDVKFDFDAKPRAKWALPERFLASVLLGCMVHDSKCKEPNQTEKRLIELLSVGITKDFFSSSSPFSV